VEAKDIVLEQFRRFRGKKGGDESVAADGWMVGEEQDWWHELEHVPGAPAHCTHSTGSWLSTVCQCFHLKRNRRQVIVAKNDPAAVSDAQFAAIASRRL
jgi:hypothetical protein